MCRFNYLAFPFTQLPCIFAHSFRSCFSLFFVSPIAFWTNESEISIDYGLSRQLVRFDQIRGMNDFVLKCKR